MDLFVINRYKEDDDPSEFADHEAQNLQKLKQRIEERKKANLARKAAQKTEIILKPQNDIAEEIIPPSITKQNEETNAKVVKKSNEKLKEEESEKTKQSEKPATEFKVLGVNDFEKKIKVRRVLPYWLSHPLTVSTSLQDRSTPVSEETWLHPTLRQTLVAEGVAHLFPVQKSVAPYIIKAHQTTGPFWPNDVCVSAPTGSGKTLAFVLPIIQVLLGAPDHAVRALVLAPVQELADQVARVFRKHCARTTLRVALLSATTPLHQQQKLLVRQTECGWASEADVVVCTAGRLVEHLRGTPGFSLRELKFLVIDEADRVMDNVQNDWLYHLDKHIKLDSQIMTGKASMLTWNNLTTQKRPPHKLLFSATLSQDPEKLQQWGLFQPKLFSASGDAQLLEEDEDDKIRKYTTPDELTEKCIVCDAEHKPLVLYYLLTVEKWKRVLCFANSSQAAHRLAALLDKMAAGELRVAEISAALDKQSREAVLKKFHSGEINVLVSTDALSRGIDVPLCDCVVSYDPARGVAAHVHRAGRTARAGRAGLALTLLTHAQAPAFKNMLNSGGKSELPEMPIPEHIYGDFAEIYERAIEETKNQIHHEIDSKVKKSIAVKRGLKSKDNRKRKNTQNKSSVASKKKKT